jgi:hypothetical protein
MTYKHVKFEDSPIMRSLEKVAQEKGLVKPEPLTKTAAVKTDLTPTTSLLDNVLKLCAGLREQGFEKQANELEVNLFNYKKAEATLYEAFPEKGEDLVHAAHPKGSHKLDGLDAQDDGAVVEDILDQHAKSLQMIEKKPTGKLASTQEAIEAVKVAIGAPPLSVKRVAKVTRAGVTEFEAGALGASTSLWSKVLGMFGKGPSTIPLAGEGAGTGAAAVSSSAAVGTVAAAASLALSAIVGGIAGYEIFENRFYVNDLKEAGQKLSSQLESVSHDMTGAESNEQTEFEASLNKALASAGRGYALLQDAKPENLEALNDYTNNLQDASQYAYQLMTWAREKNHPSNLKPGQSGGENWFSNLTNLNPFSNLRAVEISASNFINVTQKAIAAARLAISKILELSQQKAMSISDQNIGGGTSQLSQSYQSVLAQLNGYEAKLQAGNDPNKDRALQYIQAARAEVTTDQNMFEGGSADFKNKAVAGYTNKLNNIKKLLAGFAQNMRLQ